MSVDPSGCSAMIDLSPSWVRYLDALPDAQQEVVAHVWCELEPGHGGTLHCSLGQSNEDGVYFLYWDKQGALMVRREPVCGRLGRARDGSEDVCGLPADHPAGCSFEFDTATTDNQSHTAGQVRGVGERER